MLVWRIRKLGVLRVNVCESETLDSVESTSGLVQQHAGGACNSRPKKPRLTNSETSQTIHAPPPTTMEAKNA